uniref:Uncharacterized protein n=1 Tax=Chelonoidis abingdonii TaxID=106734 RepID=A0A8C0H4K1_CHEAB
MDEQDQSPLVSSSGPAQPQQPRFQYQFVRDPEEEEEVEDEDDDDFDEQLEVMERKLPAMAAAPAPAPLLDLGGSEQPGTPPSPGATPRKKKRGAAVCRVLLPVFRSPDVAAVIAAVENLGRSCAVAGYCRQWKPSPIFQAREGQQGIHLKRITKAKS